MAKLKIDAFIDPILNYINTNPDHQKYFLDSVIYI